MEHGEPTAELDPRFSSPDATPLPWAAAREQLEGSVESAGRTNDTL